MTKGDKLKQLKANFREIVGANPNFPITAEVLEIDEDTCTVKLPNGLEVPGVRLKATQDGEDNLLIIPKVGSSVLVLSSDGTVDNLTVIKCDVAEKIIFNENGLEVEIDSETKKIKVQNEQTSLKQLFSQLTEILKTLKVFTPVGPSGTPLPDTIAKIIQFENDFKTILK
ncbi:hypothetical protein [Chryseobacterium koreense]|uniref:Uncharacterized protein n=1 Tax=Chryseobacterium koreense CCUG 49689 TaxID=1304281 RepID=A0A0J7IWR7_9FLAO|nr:hypothetical protein [Chryseobacterium koreense]KMQ70244.1 hypothetical protein ACM44_13405 [Chryseobacterium koreense CCUG 49689]MBB5334745.1 uncharacterized protein YlaN (UPF0358 family) [Chryseobacterium koreense]